MPELMKLMEDWKGYITLQDIQKPEGYEQRLKETVDLVSNARGLAPHQHEYLMREAMTTSDFPYLFGDILDRQVLAAYKAVPPVWKPLFKQKNNKDFKTSRMFAISGGDQHLDLVAEKGEYLASDRVEAYFDMLLYKYGRQFDISWESLINDDLDALKDTPERFAKAVTRTEHRLATTAYARNATLYTTARGNASNAVLSIGNLETGVEAFAGFLDAGGEPILNRPKYLAVPPGLEMTARQILTSATKMWTESAGGAAWPYPTTNVIAQYGLQLIIDPYLPIIDTTDGATGWYLISDPSDIALVAYGYLSGHERPEICMKSSDKVTVGGGAITPFSGDFVSDNVFYRVRQCFGTVRLDWRAGYMGGSSLA